MDLAWSGNTVYYYFRSLIDILAFISILIMDLYVDHPAGIRLAKTQKPTGLLFCKGDMKYPIQMALVLFSKRE